MKELQTTGQEFYKGLVVKIFFSESIFFQDGIDTSLYQIVYIEEGSVIIGSEGNERTILAPVVICLNYRENRRRISFSNVRGFTVFFRPEAINHSLIGAEIPGKRQFENYLETEQLLIQPFIAGSAERPVVMSVNSMMRDRLLRIAENMKTQFYTQPDAYWPCRGRSFFLELLMLIESMSKIEPANGIELKAADKTVEPFIRTIHLSYSDPDFSLKNLPLPNGLKRFPVAVAFKKATGKSMKRYLFDLRCDVAQNLLKNTLLSVEEIARRCGYREEGKFVTDFRRMNNVAPLAWRAQFPDPYG